jgi:hypothetical protein
MTETPKCIDNPLPFNLGAPAERRALTCLICGCLAILLTIALAATLPLSQPLLSGAVSVETNSPLSPVIVRSQLTLNFLSPEWQARKSHRIVASVGSGSHFLAPSITVPDAGRVGDVRHIVLHVAPADSSDRHFDARAPPRQRSARA